MKAIQTTDNQGCELVEIDKPSVDKGQCLIKLNAAALNKRDHWITVGKYPGIQPGVTLGSDGCGRVVDGPDEWKEKEVIINPNVGWGNSEKHQSPSYTILGMPTNGTLAEYICVSTDRIIEKPDHLSSIEAAALPLAGMTAYRALFTQGEAKKGDKVLVTGAGGGVSQFVISFAMSMNCEVYVTSGSQEKIDKCLSKGIKVGVNYKEEGWFKKLKGFCNDGFDIIIDSAGGNSVNEYLKLIKPGGNIVFYGSTTGKPENLDLFRLFWSQASLKGSTMASDTEFEKMVEFVKRNNIKPEIDKSFSINEYESAFARFNHSDHFGKIIVELA